MARERAGKAKWGPRIGRWIGGVTSEWGAMDMCKIGPWIGGITSEWGAMDLGWMGQGPELRLCWTGKDTSAQNDEHRLWN